MIRVVHAELRRLVRRRTALGMVAGVVVFALVAALSVFATAGEGAPSRAGGATLADLVSPGGGTEAFAVGASFGGFLVFVIVIALFASDFASGTFRAMLLRQPHRLRLTVGKLTGFLIVTAGVLAAAEAVTFGVSWLVSAGQEISSSAWFSADGLIAAGTDYLTALAGVAGWSMFGATLAVVFQSAPLALGAGFAWAGPFENIVAESWSPGYRWFPGQVFGSLIRGGTVELGFGRAAVTAAVYAAFAAVVMLILVTRKDVTA